MRTTSQHPEVHASGKGIDRLKWENAMRGMIRTILKLHEGMSRRVVVAVRRE